jgi:DNA-binding response OmpR family regulator
MRILLVEDSERLRSQLEIALHRAGYAVDASSDGADGLWRAESGSYDVIVLDLMLPKMDGLAVLARLRAAHSHSRVLILTAKDSIADRVKGLQAGADDYLVKPFALEELLARVQSLCRRGYGTPSVMLKLGDISIDVTRKLVRRGTEPIELTKREYMLLEYLALRRGEFVSRSEIEDHIYDEGSEPLSNAVDTAVSRLRKKLDVEGRPSWIRTQRGLGYRVDAEKETT